MEYQSYAYGKNHWLLEPDLKPLLRSYWPEVEDLEDEFTQFGALAGGRAYEVADYADHRAVPELIMHDLDGRRVDRARISPSHSRLLKLLSAINRAPYEGGSWHHHYALSFLLSDPGLYCTLTVTNQTAYAIHKYAPEHSEWLDRLLAGDFFGATWMTETQGGSDLGANRTVAREEDGRWSLFGEDKYFASNAGLADLALVTARPEGAKAGPKGLALFLVPREREGGGLNFHVRRFKNKIATRAVPTGEVEFRGSEAYLVGEAEKGIYYTLENLTVSRLANAVGAMGLSRKAHLESLFRVQSREAFGRRLINHPLMRRDLTEVAVRIAAGLCLVFHAIDLFDRSWMEQPPYTSDYHYARFFSHLAKNRSADHVAEVTRLGMEVFGGLGFLEEYPIARLHREALITPIWEGTSNIQALDMLEVMQKKGAHESFLDEFIPRLESVGSAEALAARTSLDQTLERLGKLKPGEAQWVAKDALAAIADVAQVALLYRLAEGGEERYAKMASLYAHRFILGEPLPTWALEEEAVWLPEALRA